MGALRNAVKRVTHKERAQPKARSKFGLLEKHSDYTKRARNYHKKQDTLNVMKRKASMRNPDEFYMGMNHKKINSENGTLEKSGKVLKEEALAKGLGPDALKIMKDQDLAYIRLQQNKDKKQIDKLQKSLHFIGSDASTRKNRHTIFVDSETDAKNFNVASHFDTAPEFAGRAFNRPRMSSLIRESKIESTKVSDDDDEHESKKNHGNKMSDAKCRLLAKHTAKSIAKARAMSYMELKVRKERQLSLAQAEAHLVTEKLVKQKGRKRKVKEAENGTPAVYKWRRKRAN